MNIDPDSIVMWSDGTWCYYSEIDQYLWMSDDYRIIPFGSEEQIALSSLEY